MLSTHFTPLNPHISPAIFLSVLFRPLSINFAIVPLHIFLTASYICIPFSFTCGADFFPSSLHRQHYHYYFYQQLSARLSLSPDHVSIFWASNDAEGVLLAPPQSGQKFSTNTHPALRIFFFIERQRKRMKGKIPAAILRTPPT